MCCLWTIFENSCCHKLLWCQLKKNNPGLLQLFCLMIGMCLLLLLRWLNSCWTWCWIHKSQASSSTACPCMSAVSFYLNFKLTVGNSITCVCYLHCNIYNWNDTIFREEEWFFLFYFKRRVTFSPLKEIKIHLYSVSQPVPFTDLIASTSLHQTTLLMHGSFYPHLPNEILCFNSKTLLY